MADSRIEDQITAIVHGEPYSEELYSRVEALIQQKQPLYIAYLMLDKCL